MTAPPTPGDRDRNPAATVASGESAESISVLEMGEVLLRRWRLAIGLPLLACAVALLVSALVPRRYQAYASFVPETESTSSDLLASLGGLAGVASQLGVALPGGGASPQFYADLVHARTVADALLLTEFPDPRPGSVGGTAPLLEILKAKGKTPAAKLERARRRLRRLTTSTWSNRTDVVRIAVTTRYRDLSAAIANRYVELIGEFDLTTRQSNAGARRRFVEQRLAEAQADLEAAEDSLQRFLERNRRPSDAPALQVQEERLQRQVMIHQNVLLGLRQHYEDARIQEVKDTPVLTVIDSAVPPYKPSSPRMVVNTLLAGLGGVAIAVLAMLIQEIGARGRRSGRSDYFAFRERWARVGEEWRGIFSRRRPPPPSAS